MARGYEPEEFLVPARSPRSVNREAEQPSREGGVTKCDDRSQQRGRFPYRSRRNALSRELRPVYEIRGRSYRVRTSEVAAMVELGKFRVIAQEDLIEFFYSRDKDRFRPDTENLIRQGLIQVKAIPHDNNRVPHVADAHEARTSFPHGDAGRRKGSGSLSRICQAPRSPSRRGPLWPLSKSIRNDRTARRDESAGRSRLRDEEAYLPRSREARSRTGLFRLQTRNRRTPSSPGRSRQDSRSRHSHRVRNTRRREGPESISNSPPVITAGAISRKRSAPDFPSTPTPTKPPSSGESWINAN